MLADIATKAGLERQRFFAEIETDACKARLRANTDELIARGGFGSPTMFVGSSMFFGNDRLPLVKAALMQMPSPPAHVWTGEMVNRCSETW